MWYLNGFIVEGYSTRVELIIFAFVLLFLKSGDEVEGGILSQLGYKLRGLGLHASLAF